MTIFIIILIKTFKKRDKQNKQLVSCISLLKEKKCSPPSPLLSYNRKNGQGTRYKV